MGRHPNPREPKMTYDMRTGFARFEGPGGFTEQAMSRENAEAVAKVYDAPIEIKEH